MAKRINLHHDEETRRKIQTTQLVNRLESHAFSNADKEVMTQSQVRAAEILLRKSLPDISSVVVSGDEDQPIEMKHTFEWLAPPKSE